MDWKKIDGYSFLDTTSLNSCKKIICSIFLHVSLAKLSVFPFYWNIAAAAVEVGVDVD